MLILFLFLIHVYQSFSYTFPPSITSSDNRYIWDLWGGTVDINGNAQDWSYSDILPTATTLTTSSCNGGTMFGGPGIFPGKTTLSRTYSNLSPHNFVYYAINIIAVDDWQPSDKFSIKIDGITVGTWTPASHMSTYGGSSVCGGASNDLIYTIIGKKSHTADSLTLKIITDIASSGASIVVYNVVFSFPVGNIVEANSVNICFPAGCLIGTTLIGLNQYLDSSLVPQSCDLSCSRCFGSGPSKCFKCKETTHSFDGISCATCPSNCFQCASSTVCTRCLPGFVLDSDGTCKTSCSTSTDIAKGNNLGTKVCIAPPCYSPQYMSWNYTCQSSCSEPPLHQNLLYCEYPCSYLQYLYPDGSCLYTCPFPYSKRVEPGTKYCDIPCGGTGYVYEDGSCGDDCAAYMTVSITVSNIKLCKSPVIDLEDLKEVEKMGKASDIGGKILSVATKVTSIVSPSNPTAITAGNMIKMLLYLRYLNITRSMRLESYFNTVYLGFDDIIPEVTLLTDLEDDFDDKRLPYMFRKYNIQSNFLGNYMNDFGFLVVYLAIVLMIWLINWMMKIFRNIPYVRSFLKNSKIIFQNFFIGQVYESYGEIIFYSCIGFRSASVKGGNNTLSFLAAISCILAGILLFIGHFYILFKYRKIKQGQRRIAKISPEIPDENLSETFLLYKFKEKTEGVQIFYEDFKDTSATQQAYLLVVMIRVIIFNLVLVLLFDYPMVQIIIIACFNLLMVIYILWQRPLVSPIELVQELLYELILLTANICFLILANLDAKNSGFSTHVLRISEGVIFVGIICRYLPILFLGLTGLETMWTWYKGSNSPRKIVKASKSSSKSPNIVIHYEDENTMTPKPDSDIIYFQDEANMNNNVESYIPINEEDSVIETKGITKARNNEGQVFFDWSKFETSLNVSSDQILPSSNMTPVEKVEKKSSTMKPVQFLMAEIDEQIKKKSDVKGSTMYDHFNPDNNVGLENVENGNSSMNKNQVASGVKKVVAAAGFKKNPRNSKGTIGKKAKVKESGNSLNKTSSKMNELIKDEDETRAKRVMKDE